MPPVPAAILQALSLSSDPSKVSLSGLGSGFTNTGVIRAKVINENGKEEERQYFVKTSSDGKSAEEMLRGEYESLNAIASAVPGFCPRALAWGPIEESSKSKTFFLVTEYLDLGGRTRRSSSGEMNPSTLAYRLGRLHTIAAPPDPKTGEVLFGFHVPTFCGDTKQPNKQNRSWADFYAHERLLTILAASEQRNGRDKELRELVEKTAYTVVPHLLGDGHLGYSNGEGEGIVPVVVHGDLWSGNADRGRIWGNGGDDQVGDVVYDPCVCYGHNEFELGIMHMFGGFGTRFFDQYHRVVPKTAPVEEYDDRVRLYELYHHLNHHAIFGGGYRSGAVSIMQKLIRKYGEDEGEGESSDESS
ncbi:hypothetical protein N7490_000184 [Penicillium lividum]|nr:hypothetical protein N7490_000184 [Penicillium lividum]